MSNLTPLLPAKGRSARLLQQRGVRIVQDALLHIAQDTGIPVCVLPRLPGEADPNTEGGDAISIVPTLLTAYVLFENDYTLLDPVTSSLTIRNDLFEKTNAPDFSWETLANDFSAKRPALASSAARVHGHKVVSASPRHVEALHDDAFLRAGGVIVELLEVGVPVSGKEAVMHCGQHVFVAVNVLKLPPRRFIGTLNHLIFHDDRMYSLPPVALAAKYNKVFESLFINDIKSLDASVEEQMTWKYRWYPKRISVQNARMSVSDAMCYAHNHGSFDEDHNTPTVTGQDWVASASSSVVVGKVIQSGLPTPTMYRVFIMPNAAGVHEIEKILRYPRQDSYALTDSSVHVPILEKMHSEEAQYVHVFEGRGLRSDVREVLVPRNNILYSLPTNPLYYYARMSHSYTIHRSAAYMRTTAVSAETEYGVQIAEKTSAHLIETLMTDGIVSVLTDQQMADDLEKAEDLRSADYIARRRLDEHQKEKELAAMIAAFNTTGSAMGDTTLSKDAIRLHTAEMVREHADVRARTRNKAIAKSAVRELQKNFRSIGLTGAALKRLLPRLRSHMPSVVGSLIAKVGTRVFSKAVATAAKAAALAIPVINVIAGIWLLLDLSFMVVDIIDVARGSPNDIPHPSAYSSFPNFVSIAPLERAIIGHSTNRSGTECISRLIVAVSDGLTQVLDEDFWPAFREEDELNEKMVRFGEKMSIARAAARQSEGELVSITRDIARDATQTLNEWDIENGRKLPNAIPLVALSASNSGTYVVATTMRMLAALCVVITILYITYIGRSVWTFWIQTASALGLVLTSSPNADPTSIPLAGRARRKRGAAGAFSVVSALPPAPDLKRPKSHVAARLPTVAEILHPLADSRPFDGTSYLRGRASYTEP